MTPGTMVVEDGIGESGSGSRDRSRWVLAAVGFGLGLAFGAFLAAPPRPPSTDAIASDPDQVLPPAEPVEGEASEGTVIGISEAVPGFPDTLAALGRDSGSGFEYYLWPRRGPLAVRTMTGGSDVSFDASGAFLALTGRVPDLDGLVLSRGRAGGIRPVVSGATSYAWHDSDQGRLSYTTEEDGEWYLFILTTPEPVVTADEVGGVVAAWGDWGFAIQSAGSEVTLYTGQGDLKGRTDGQVLTSHATGWILVRDEGLKLVSAGGGVRRIDPPHELEGVTGGSFSPDGTSIALTGRGVVVVDLDTTEVTSLDPRYRAEWVAWSSDSRFVIAPALTGVVVYDLETGASVPVLAGSRIVAAAAIPHSGS